MKTISVIIPAFRVDQYLNRCMNSIYKQTFIDYEILLTDDGSDDFCGTLTDEYAAMSSQTIVIHQKNQGLSAARNVGIDISQGEFVTFIDSDDWVNERYLETLYMCYISEGCPSIVGAKYCNDESEEKNEEIEKERIIIDTDNYYSINKPFPLYAPINAWGKLFSRDLFYQIKFPFGKVHEDRFTTHKLIFEYDQVVYWSEPLYYYFDNPVGITRARWNPRHMDDVEAFEEQLVFFDKKMKYKPYCEIAKQYLDSLFVNMWEIRQLNGEFSNEYIVLKQKLVKALHKFRKKLCLGNFSKYDYYAYPLKMKFYDIYKSLIKRL